METGIKVGDVMKTGLVTISDGSMVYEAAKKMRDKGLSSLLVTQGNGDKIYGIITNTDIVNKAIAGGKGQDCKVKEILSKPLVGIEPEADISDAAKLMGSEELRRLVVLKEGKIVGILSERDIIKISPSLYDLIAEKAEGHLK